MQATSSATLRDPPSCSPQMLYQFWHRIVETKHVGTDSRPEARDVVDDGSQPPGSSLSRHVPARKASDECLQIAEVPS